MTGIEKTFEASGAQIQKYLPERHQEIGASVASLRGDLLSQEKFMGTWYRRRPPSQMPCAGQLRKPDPQGPGPGRT